MLIAFHCLGVTRDPNGLEDGFTEVVRTGHVSVALGAAGRDEKRSFPAERLGHAVVPKAFAAVGHNEMPVRYFGLGKRF